MLALLRAMLGLGRSEASPAPAAPAETPPAQEGAPARASLLSARDLDRLRGVHPDLVRVVQRAREAHAFTVIEGLRTPERQRELFARGASRTLASRHLTGHAVDLGPVPLDWKDGAAFRRLAGAMKRAADEEGVALVWGGDWISFYDGPHFELDRRKYPG